MATHKVELEIEADTSQMSKGMATAAMAAKGLQGQFKKIGDRVKGLGSRAFSGMAKGIIGVTAAVGGATVAFQGLRDLLGKVHGNMDAMHRANLFGTSMAEAQKLQATLSDVKTTMGALQLATDLKIGGFADKQVQQFGHMINAISALSGQSKEVVEDALKTGELTGKQLAVIGKSQQDMELVLMKASNKVGGRALGAMEKAKALTAAWGDELTKIDNKLGRFGASNPFDDLAMSIKSVTEEIFTNLAPTFRKLSEYVRTNKKEIIESVKTIVEFSVQAFSMIPKFLMFAWNKAKKMVTGFYDALPSIVKKGLGLVGKAAKGAASWVGLDKAGDDFKALKKMMNAEYNARLKETADKEKKIATQAQKVKTELRKKYAAKNRRRAGVQARLEAQEEIQGYMKETRMMIRNFENYFLDAVSNLGGPVSGIFSAMKDAPELFKKFSTSFSSKSLAKNLDLTVEQIQAMEKAGKMTAAQAKAQTMLNLQMKGGTLDLREYLNNERIVNTQLKADINLSEAQKQIATARVEMINQDKDIRGAIVAIQRVINRYSKSDNEINRRQAKLLSGALVQYKEIAKHRRAMLNLQVQLGKLEREDEKRRTGYALKDARVEAVQRLVDLQRELDTIQGKRTESQVISDAAAIKIAELRRNIRDMVADADKLSQRINLSRGVVDADTLQLLTRQHSALIERIKLRAAEVDKVRELTDAQKQQLTVAGTILTQARQQIAGFSQQLGQQFYQGIQTAVGGLGGIVSSTMETLVSGVGGAAENAGKMFLDVLAGAAAQLGSFYIASGTAQMFVPPYTGAGAIAGGTALLGLSGALKGLGSLIGGGASTPSTPSVSTGGASAPNVNPPTLPGQQTRDERAVNFFFASAPLPWQQTSEQQQVREMSRWGERMAREGRDPFNVPRTMNARRFA